MAFLFATWLLGMAEIYEKGISPITQDGSKALELYKRGMKLFPKAVGHIYLGKQPNLDHTYRYSFGHATFDSLNIMLPFSSPPTLSFSSPLRTPLLPTPFYLPFPLSPLDLARVYEKGIHPIPQHTAKALEYRIMALEELGSESPSDLHRVYDGTSGI